MLIVQKYGGTSVANVERIKNVAKRVVETAEKGHSVLVVVSAMAGETDKLINLAHQINENPSEREMDLLLSSGERITCALTAMAIERLGKKAIALTGRQFGIYTDSVHTRAHIEYITGERAKKALKDGNIVVVAGFQGIAKETDEVTTLGRGGSDLSAVAIAYALKADLCEIYTDVDGVYTADPNIVKRARKIKKITYEEMLELASLGAKVLQTRSVEVAAKFKVPLMVRSSFNYNEGTLITSEDKDMEKVVVSAIAHDKNQSKITIKGALNRPGVAAQIFKSIAAKNIIVDMIGQNITKGDERADISFTIPRSETREALRIVKELKKDIGYTDIDVNENIGKVSIVGVGMRTHSGVAAKMFETLSEHGINIMMINTSEISVSCIIELKYVEMAVRVLHDAFGLENEMNAQLS
ncbi:MAG: aspartate kinase [Deltaproteobacteria bacterium]|nr:aspartate kinase [Deltaproteobacteria bacterium]